MRYAILIYDCEDMVCALTRREDDALVAGHTVVQRRLAAEGRLGPVVRLMPTTTATTFRPDREPPVIDGPFAETEEQLLGLYVVECPGLEQAIEIARSLPRVGSVFEIRPIDMFFSGGGPGP